jgi:hypothetical protein
MSVSFEFAFFQLDAAPLATNVAENQAADIFRHINNA